MRLGRARPRPPLPRRLLPQAPHEAAAAPVPFGAAPTLPAPSEAEQIAETVRGIAISTPEEWAAAVSAALGPAATRVSAAGGTLGAQSAELATALRQALHDQPAELAAALTNALAQPEQLAAALAAAVEDPQMRSALVVGGFGGLALVVADAVRKVGVGACLWLRHRVRHVGAAHAQHVMTCHVSVALSISPPVSTPNLQANRELVWVGNELLPVGTQKAAPAGAKVRRSRLPTGKCGLAAYWTACAWQAFQLRSHLLWAWVAAHSYGTPHRTQLQHTSPCLSVPCFHPAEGRAGVGGRSALQGRQPRGRRRQSRPGRCKSPQGAAGKWLGCAASLRLVATCRTVHPPVNSQAGLPWPAPVLRSLLPPSPAAFICLPPHPITSCPYRRPATACSGWAASSSSPAAARPPPLPPPPPWLPLRPLPRRRPAWRRRPPRPASCRSAPPRSSWLSMM